MHHVRQFVPQSVCLSCQGCCRYAERDTVWAPVFLFEEIVELTQKNVLPVCLFTHSYVHKKEAVRIDLIEEEGGFICPCFDSKKNTCKIYAFHPLDCQLYPFLLVARDGKKYLALDEHCPYTQEQKNLLEFKKYVEELTLWLHTKEFFAIAAANPAIFQEYPGKIELLASLSFS
jgi:Fe-S-cluster containining protein